MFSSNTQEVFEQWKNGGASQKDVINSIVSDIQGCTNQQEKMNMAAKAFGTMAEDGNTKFIESLTPVGDAFDNVSGKAQQLNDTLLLHHSEWKQHGEKYRTHFRV